MLEVARGTRPELPLLPRLAAVRSLVERALPLPEAAEDGESFTPAEVAAALLAWAPPYADLDRLAEAVAERRGRLAKLRRDDAALTLATEIGRAHV